MTQKSIKKYFPIFVLPTLIAFTIAFLIPFILGLGLSFSDFTLVTDAKFNGLTNYIKAFTDPSSNFLYSLGFTALFTVINIVVVNVCAFALAVLLTKGLKGSNVFRSVFFAPNLIGGIVLGYVWNTIMQAFLQGMEKTLSSSPHFGFWGLVIVVSWQMIGYMMIIYIAGINNIPTEVKEAALIDGANVGQTLINVTIPMIMPSITICSFLTLINSFKLFDQNLALTGGDPAYKTEMLALNIYRTFYNRNGWSGPGQAKAVVFFLLVGLIALIQLRLTRAKEADR